MRPHALLVVAAGAVCGCSEPVEGAAWRFRFADANLAARAQLVRTEIRAGGCGGAPVFVTRVSPDSPGQSPPELSSGRFGFYGRARDADCLWFAEGCAEADLPARAGIEVVLNRLVTGDLDPACVPGQRDEDPIGVGSNGGSSDASDDTANSGGNGGTGAIDGGPVTSGGEPDAGPGSETDAAVAAFDPRAPKCTNLDTQVVACFDFDGSVSDASAFDNDPGPASNASFEAARSGDGLRVSGRTLAVPDAAGLNVSVFTIEVWLRVDSLTNLQGQINENSLLLDKDQQYNVGFSPAGVLRMEVYRALNDQESTTAQSAVLTVGRFAYAAFVYDGSNARIYLDGALRESEVVGLSLFKGSGGTMHIGSGSPGTTRSFDGLIDALRISKVARSDAELCRAAGKRFSGGVCQ